MARLAQEDHQGPTTEQGPLAEPLRGKPARNMEPEVGLEDWPFCLQDEPLAQGLPLGHFEEPHSGVIGALHRPFGRVTSIRGSSRQPLLLSAGKLVPYPTDRVKMPGFPRIWFEILPESDDEVIHRAGRGKHVVPPYFLENLFPGYHLAFSIH